MLTNEIVDDESDALFGEADESSGLPVLEKLLSGDTSKFTKGLIDLATQVAKVFTSLGGPGGPLVIFVETLARMAEALAFLSENVPGFNHAPS